MSWNSVEWASAAAVVSAFIAAVAAGISLWQAREFRKQIIEDSRLKKIQRTIELVPNYSDEYIRCSKYIFLKIPAVVNGPLSDEAWGKIKQDIELVGAIAQVLHFWARFAICYYEGTLDFEVAKMTCQGGFLSVMRTFEDRLKEMDEASGSQLLLKLYDEWK